MITGIGVDVCDISRVSGLMERKGDNFAKRILAPVEYEEFLLLNLASRPAFCAKRFAVKEAFSKAFGTGIGRGFGFHDIWIVHSEGGQPKLQWANGNHTLSNLTNANICLSVSDEKSIAIAFCTIESVQ